MVSHSLVSSTVRVPANKEQKKKRLQGWTRKQVKYEGENSFAGHGRWTTLQLQKHSQHYGMPASPQGKEKGGKSIIIR